MRKLSDFYLDTTGNFAVIVSLLAFPLLFGLGLALDYGVATKKRAEFQNHADAAALAAANRISLGGGVATDIIKSAEEFASSQFVDNPSTVVKAEMPDKYSITVTISENWAPIFAHLISSKVTPIVATATAQTAGRTSICVLSLSPTMSSSVTLTGAAQIRANGCSVYANSTDRYAITSYKDSILDAALICSAGGTSVGMSNFNPEPTTDCPSINDPLASWPAPTYGSCDHDGFMINSGSHILNPGVYCGGMLITGSARATLREGVYIIKDGPLTVAKTASLEGEHVGFYLTGTQAVFLFANTSTVSLSAPVNGPLTGLLFFEDRTSPMGRYFEIVSENARRLVGTIYLPRGNFLVSSQKPVADLSEFTAVIANSIQLHKYPSLVLNTDYHKTDVPVPAGLSNGAADIRLAR